MAADKIIGNDILRDMVITELEKYRKMLIEQGLEGREKLDELIEILEHENLGEGTTET
jgi:hypothetical protein